MAGQRGHRFHNIRNIIDVCVGFFSSFHPNILTLAKADNINNIFLCYSSLRISAIILKSVLIFCAAVFEESNGPTEHNPFKTYFLTEILYKIHIC